MNSSYLSLLNEVALKNTHKHLSLSPKFDLIQLSSYLQTLASSLYTYLKQTLFHGQTNQRQMSIQLELTETETCALEVSISVASRDKNKTSGLIDVFRFYKAIH